MNTKDIERLIAMVENTDIEEIEYQSKEDKVRIKRSITPIGNIAVQGHHPSMPAPNVTYVGGTPMVPATQVHAQPQPAPVVDTSQKMAPDATTFKEITSPFVGTFYRAPAPDSDPFVQRGDRVKKGDTLCIVEAMKLMNEIEAECSGTIKEILIDNAQPVEFGEVLFLIEPN